MTPHPPPCGPPSPLRRGKLFFGGVRAPGEGFVSFSEGRRWTATGVLTSRRGPDEGSLPPPRPPVACHGHSAVTEMLPLLVGRPEASGRQPRTLPIQGRAHSQNSTEMATRCYERVCGCTTVIPG